MKEVIGNQAMARKCIMSAISRRPNSEASTSPENGLQQLTAPTPALGSGGPATEASCEDLEKVLVGSDPERFFQVGSELPPQEKEMLIDFLRQNVDVFA